MATRSGRSYKAETRMADGGEGDKVSLMEMMQMMLQDRQQQEEERKRREEEFAEERERHERDAAVERERRERESEEHLLLMQRQVETLEHLVAHAREREMATPRTPNFQTRTTSKPTSQPSSASWWCSRLIVHDGPTCSPPNSLGKRRRRLRR